MILDGREGSVGDNGGKSMRFIETKSFEDFGEEQRGDSSGIDGFLGRAENYPLSKCYVFFPCPSDPPRHPRMISSNPCVNPFPSLLAFPCPSNLVSSTSDTPEH